MDDRPGDGTPFPQSQSWTTYGGKEYGLFACCRKFAAAQLAIACPDINNYFTTDSSFPYFITFFVRPESSPAKGGVYAYIRDRLFLLRTVIILTRCTLVIPTRR